MNASRPLRYTENMSDIQIFKEISIGGLGKTKLINQLVEGGVQFNKYAEILFEHSLFSPDVNAEEVKLIKVNYQYF